MAHKGLSSQSYGFSSSQVWMWELDYKESWEPKNWGFWTVVLEKTLESSSDYKEIKPVNPKGNQPWIFIRRTDAEADAPILRPRDMKNWLIEKDPDAGKDWRQEEKRMTEDEIIGWHHQLYGHEFEQSPGVADGQGSLACCSPWGCKEPDMTELNWTELNLQFGKIRLQRTHTQVALVVNNPPAHARDVKDAVLIPGLGRSPGVGNGNPLQYSCLENYIDRGAWQAIVHGAAKSQTWLSDWEHSTHMCYAKVRLLGSPLCHPDAEAMQWKDFNHPRKHHPTWL